MILLFPVSHSVLCTQALAKYISLQFNVGTVVRCDLIQRRVSDTYVVQCATKRYALRIYRRHWRTKQQIQAELLILDHLLKYGCRVPAYVSNTEGKSIQTLVAPEGERYGVLFEWMMGRSFDEKDLDSALIMPQFGASAARMHQVLDSFPLTEHRFHLDIDWMLNRPIEKVRHYLSHEPKYLKDIQRYGRWLTDFLVTKTKQSSRYGLIHGDLLPANALAYCDTQGSEANMDVGIIDFDFSGYGWRAYDIAVFIHDNSYLNGKNGFIERYLQGYETVRVISDEEWSIVEALLPIRGIWFLALWASNSQDWGDEFLRDKKYIKQQMDFNRQLIYKLLSRQELPL